MYFVYAHSFEYKNLLKNRDFKGCDTKKEFAENMFKKQLVKM